MTIFNFLFLITHFSQLDSIKITSNNFVCLSAFRFTKLHTHKKICIQLALLLGSSTNRLMKDLQNYVIANYSVARILFQSKAEQKCTHTSSIFTYEVVGFISALCFFSPSNVPFSQTHTDVILKFMLLERPRILLSSFYGFAHSFLSS